MPTTANPPDLLRVRQVAKTIGCSEATVRRRVADGTLPTIRFGGLRLIPRSALESLLRGAL